MEKAKVNTKKSPQNEAETVSEAILEELDVDLYSTLRRWEALYPHTYGDLILEEVLKGK